MQYPPLTAVRLTIAAMVLMIGVGAAAVAWEAMHVRDYMPVQIQTPATVQPIPANVTRAPAVTA